jgi:hypothetical protein
MARTLRRFCFLLSSPADQNGFAGKLKNVVGTVAHETASRTREDNYVRMSDKSSAMNAVG